MKKIITIGDIHGRGIWKTFADIKHLLVAEPDAAGFGPFEPDYDYFVFLGDYTDSFIYDSTGYMVIHNEMEVLNSEKGQETKQGNKSYIRYNTLGLKIELTKCNSDDSLIYESNYKYDPNGNLIEENLSYQKNEFTRTCMGSFADPYGVKVGDFYRYSYKYDYDTVGNWIYRYEYRGPFSEILTIRLFEYY